MIIIIVFLALVVYGIATYIGYTLDCIRTQKEAERRKQRDADKLEAQR